MAGTGTPAACAGYPSSLSGLGAPHRQVVDEHGMSACSTMVSAVLVIEQGAHATPAVGGDVIRSIPHVGRTRSPLGHRVVVGDMDLAGTGQGSSSFGAAPGRCPCPRTVRGCSRGADGTSPEARHQGKQAFRSAASRAWVSASSTTLAIRFGAAERR